MKILAVETSGQVAGCAVLDDDILSADYNILYKKTHSQSLIPMLDEIKRMLELDLSTIDAIAVTKGPGSFTGLRIGAATVKGLGLAMDRPVIPVPTVDCLAYNLGETDRQICPIMDARRQQVYTGLYDWEEKDGERELRTVVAQYPAAIDEIAQRINESKRATIFLGDGVPVYRERLKELLTVPYTFAPAHLSRQRAGSLAALAMQYWRLQGEACFVSADDFRPEYLRMSQAERERMEQQK